MATKTHTELLATIADLKDDAYAGDIFAAALERVIRLAKDEGLTDVLTVLSDAFDA